MGILEVGEICAPLETGDTIVCSYTNSPSGILSGGTLVPASFADFFFKSVTTMYNELGLITRSSNLGITTGALLHFH